MKKTIDFIVDIFFAVSLVWLSKFSDMSLLSYQFVAFVFWETGLYKFRNSKEIKDFFNGSLKEVIAAIIIILSVPLLGVNIEDDILLFPISTVLHFALLLIILWGRIKSFELSGSIAYITSAMVPLITFGLIFLGMPIIPSVFLAFFLPEPFNYLAYLKAYIKNRNRECAEAFLSLDKDKILKFAKKYYKKKAYENIPQDPKEFWKWVHTSILGISPITPEQESRSREWLDKNGLIKQVNAPTSAAAHTGR